MTQKERINLHDKAIEVLRSCGGQMDGNEIARYGVENCCRSIDRRLREMAELCEGGQDLTLYGYPGLAVTRRKLTANEMFDRGYKKETRLYKLITFSPLIINYPIQPEKVIVA